MTKWIHKPISENSKKWEDEKLRRVEERRILIEEWEKTSRLEKIKKIKEKLKLKKDKEDNKDPEREEDDDLIDIATNMEGTWMNWRKTEPEEDEIVPTEDGEVEAEIESVEIQGAVREEPVDWKEDGEDMELVEQLGDLGQDDRGSQRLCLKCTQTLYLYSSQG